jgi:hypothetical protein
MNVPEILTTLREYSEIVTALSTAALVWVTFVLARHTRSLQKWESSQQRIRDLDRCIQLGAVVIRSGLLDDIVPALNELLVYGRYFNDSDTKRDLEYITGVINSGIVNGELVFKNRDFEHKYRQFRGRISEEMKGWQKKLGTYGGSDRFEGPGSKGAVNG